MNIYASIYRSTTKFMMAISFDTQVFTTFISDLETTTTTTTSSQSMLFYWSSDLLSLFSIFYFFFIESIFVRRFKFPRKSTHFQYMNDFSMKFQFPIVRARWAQVISIDSSDCFGNANHLTYLGLSDFLSDQILIYLIEFDFFWWLSNEPIEFDIF